MTILAPPSAVPQLSPVCPNNRHQYIQGGFPNWLRCIRCGQPNECKGCAYELHHADVVRLPDVFCARHANLVEQFTARPLSQGELASRLVYLAGSVPKMAWRLSADRASERADLLLPGYRLVIEHGTKMNAWRMWVYIPDGSPAPVFAVEGPSALLHVRYIQPGPWIDAVQQTTSLRGAEAQG